MARTSLDAVLHCARTLVAPVAELPEAQLLDRFLARGEESAFAALVGLHGPMVLTVCRRLLSDEHDAEDAFQATFLVLARRAASLRKRGSVASWLYGVACRVAWRARAAAARRRICERAAAVPRAGATAALAVEPDLLEVLGEELARLPENYRQPVVLCHLEGRTHEEAARRLGWPVGSVKGRLARARALLRTRLTRRGLAPSAGVLAAALGGAAAAVPPALARETVRVALAFGQGATADGASASAAALAEEAVPAVACGKVKAVLTALLILAAFGAAAGALLPAGTAPPPPAEGRAKAPAPPRVPPLEAAHVDLHGDPLPAGARARLGTARFRQGSEISALVWSPDGQLLASAGWEPTVYIWNADTGRCLRRLVGHDDKCRAVAFSPDGKLVASGSQDNTVRLWDVATGQAVRHFVGHAHGVNSVAFAPDGKLLASTGGGGGLILWDARTGRELRRLRKVSKPLFNVAFSADGKTVAAGSGEGMLHLWEVATGHERARLAGQGNVIVGATYSPDGKHLASGGLDGCASLWDASGKLVRSWPDRNGYVYSVAFSPDGKTLAVGHYVSSLLVRSPPNVRLWDVATGQEARRLEDCVGAVTTVAFSPDGKTLAAADGPAIRRWDVGTGKERPPRGGHLGPVWSVAVSADGKTVFSGAMDAGLRRWDATTGKEIRRLVGHKSAVFRVALTPDGKLLGSVGLEPAVYLWDADGTRPLRQLPGHDGLSVRAIALAPEGRTVVTAADGQGLRLWDTATGKQVRQFTPRDRVYCVAFAPDGRTLASGGADETGYQCLRVWDVATGRPLGGSKGLERWYSVAFSPDGQWVAAGVESSTEPDRLYHARGKEIRRMPGHRGVVHEVAFSADGRMLVSGGADGTVRLWEVATGQERRRLEGHIGPVHAVAVSADGRTLVSGGADTTVLVWDMDDRITALRQKPPPTRAQMEGRWAELGDPDAARAYQAICQMAAFPNVSVPLLRERLLGKQPAGDVGRWIRQLDDKHFTVRERATEELAKLGRRVEADLRGALNGVSPEARLRLERLLAALPGGAAGPEDAVRLRTLRALEALERAGTAQAREVVAVLARGDGSWLAAEARAVLRRLDRRMR